MSLTYAAACRDPNLFGPWFEAPSWDAWRVIDKALFGEPLDDNERTIFRELTGRDNPPTEPTTEAWFIVGRRGGKDVKAASLAVYLATIGAELYGYLARLVRGERGVVQVLAVDRDQARVCLGYTKAFFEQPMLARMVKRDTADGIELTNGLAVEITTNDRRRVRGRTVVAAVFDEVAFWRSENSVNPDEEIYRAVKPAMATIPGAMLIGISSPYARRGLLYQKWKSNYGQPGNILVVQAPTWTMNPTLPRDGDVIAEAYSDDPVSAAAEFGAQFRDDIEDYLSHEVVEAAVDTGVYERPPQADLHFVGFADPSGGRSDSMTLCIAHRDGDAAVIDLLREVKPPFNPESVVKDFASDLRRYHISRANMDRYGAEWVRAAFTRHNIDARPADKPKSDLYVDLLPPINSGLVRLLDSPRLVSQLTTLERRTARGGRDSVDHPPGGHDDLANSVAGAVHLALRQQPPALPELALGEDGWMPNPFAFTP